MRRCVQAGACGSAAATARVQDDSSALRFQVIIAGALRPPQTKVRRRALWLSYAHVALLPVVSMIEAEARHWLPILGWGMYAHI